MLPSSRTEALLVEVAGIEPASTMPTNKSSYDHKDWSIEIQSGNVNEKVAPSQGIEP